MEGRSFSSEVREEMPEMTATTDAQTNVPPTYTVEAKNEALSIQSFEVLCMNISRVN